MMQSLNLGQCYQLECLMSDGCWWEFYQKQLIIKYTHYKYNTL